MKAKKATSTEIRVRVRRESRLALYVLDVASGRELWVSKRLVVASKVYGTEARRTGDDPIIRIAVPTWWASKRGLV